MDIQKLIKILDPYCTKIVHNKHWKVYPKGSNQIISIAGTPSDRNYHREVYRDFRRLGIIIKELNY